MNEIMGYFGFLAMWFSCFSISFFTMLADDTQGPVRDFTAVSQLICCTNLVSMSYGMMNRVPVTKASLFTINLDLFVTWTAFAYYGGSDVFSDSAIGVWNYIQVIMFSFFSASGIAGLFAIANDPNGFNKYLEDSYPTKGESENSTVNEADL